MENVVLKVWDAKTEAELLGEHLGLLPINDKENQGRKMITYSPTGDPSKAQNIGILNPDGSTEAQPGYVIRVTQAD